jgi:small subunit ribosomal protein S21
LRPNFELMLSIPVKEGDNIERALKRFKKKFDRTKRMRELRSRREFVKPSVQNREQMKKAVYKNGLNMKNE